MSATLAIDSRSKGSVAVPAKLLLEFLKLSQNNLTFTVEENSTMKLVLTLVNMLCICSW
jgi:DNA polymerase-3 subunit beta